MPEDLNMNFTGDFQIAKFELKPGEVFVVKIDQYIDQRLHGIMTIGFKNFLKKAGYPQIPVLVLEKGMSVEIADLSKIPIIECGRCEKDGIPSEWVFVKSGKPQNICLFCENAMRDRADLIFDEKTKTISLWEEKDN